MTDNKYEFVKETKINGETIFYTKKNGSYVSDSIGLCEEEGRKLYDMIVERGDLKPIVEILETKHNG